MATEYTYKVDGQDYLFSNEIGQKEAERIIRNEQAVASGEVDEYSYENPEDEGLVSEHPVCWNPRFCSRSSAGPRKQQTHHNGCHKPT